MQGRIRRTRESQWKATLSPPSQGSLTGDVSTNVEADLLTLEGVSKDEAGRGFFHNASCILGRKVNNDMGDTREE